jgi:hypothetical protein
MKVMGEKTSPSRKYKYVDSAECDVCGAVSRLPEPDAVGTSWTAENYMIDETSIIHRVGCSYPEGGDIETIECDICPRCFDEHIVKHLESLGVVFSKTSVDF